MSITTEISRITKAKEDIRTSLVNKGATISETAKLDEYSAIIDEMTIGSGGTSTDSDGLVMETENYSGGTLSALTTSVTSISFPKTGVKSLSGTCSGMTSLKTVKRFPNDVTNMNNTFNFCRSLVSVPTIPDSVTGMAYIFRGCTSLIDISNISTGITDMTYTFQGCTSLVSVPTIPDSVTDMYYTFCNCTSLTGITNFPTNAEKLQYTFSGCTSLVSVPTIPDSVTNITGAFINCTGLTSIPNIPTGLTYMSSTFRGCTSIKKVPEIRSNKNKNFYSLFNMNGAFKGCSSLEEIILNTHCKPNMDNSTFSGCPTTLKIYVNEGLIDYFKTDSNTKDFTILPIEKRWYQYDKGGGCDNSVIYGVRVKEFNGSYKYSANVFVDDSNNKTYMKYNTTEKRFETYTVINDVTSETTVLQPDENGYYKIMFDKPVKIDSQLNYPVELFI